MDHQFDVLAKTMALAGEMPRREAVRRVGGALAAAALASLGVGCSSSGGGRGASPMSPLPPGTSAEGRTPQGGGNSDCAHFCQQAFPPGPQRGQCVSDAANGTGLCVQCNADITRLCNGVCCASGQSCCSGACVNLQTDVHNCGTCGNTCASSFMCASGACVCPPGTTNMNGKCKGPCGCPPGYVCVTTYIGSTANVSCCPSGGGVCCAPDQC